MAKGKPKKWATATVLEPIHLGKAGIEIIVWDKYKKTNTRLGTAVISVGGIRWKQYKAQKSHRVTWDQLSEM